MSTETVVAKRVHRPSSALTGRLSRFAPALVAAAGCVGILLRYDTPWSAIVLYGIYLLLVICVPGTILWRVLRPGTRVSFAEDAAVGSALGLAIQALLGWMLAPIHLAPYSALWSPVILVIALTVPRLRRRVFRTSAEPNQTLGSSWLMAATILLAALWLGSTSFGVDQIAPIPGTTNQYYLPNGYGDFPFHQALTIGIDQFTPLVYPYACQIPLHYQIFVYEHLANAAQLTGIDPSILIARLVTLPLVAITAVIAGTLTHRISKRAGAAGFGTFMATIAMPLSLYPAGQAVLSANTGSLNLATYRSPTQTFGEPIFLAVLTVLCIALTTHTKRRAWVGYAVYGVIGFCAECSKATFLPLLGCGLALALLAQLIFKRRLNIKILIFGIVTVAAQLASMLFVYGFSPHGLTAQPFQLIQRSSGYQMLGPQVTAKEYTVLIVLTALAWIAPAVGGILLARMRYRDCVTWLLLGIVIAGICAALLFSQSGTSQVYFLRSAAPVLAIVTTLGICAFQSSLRLSSTRFWAVVSGALLAGVISVFLVRRIDRAIAGVGPYSAKQMLIPWIILFAAAALIAVVGGIVVRRLQADRNHSSPAPVVALIAVTAIAGATLAPVLKTDASALQALGQPVVYGQDGWSAPIPAGGVEAARWLRDHSDPTDIVATNAHEYDQPQPAGHFYISAYSERRVLLEGWDYTDPDPDLTQGTNYPVDYWDPDFLEQNDVVFSAPTQANVDNLKEQYGVDWLFVDRTISKESPDLQNYAQLVYQNSDAAIYRLD